jgi:hypothetical protein
LFIKSAYLAAAAQVCASSLFILPRPPKFVHQVCLSCRGRPSLSIKSVCLAPAAQVCPSRLFVLRRPPEGIPPYSQPPAGAEQGLTRTSVPHGLPYHTHGLPYHTDFRTTRTDFRTARTDFRTARTDFRTARTSEPHARPYHTHGLPYHTHGLPYHTHGLPYHTDFRTTRTDVPHSPRTAGCGHAGRHCVAITLAHPRPSTQAAAIEPCEQPAREQPAREQPAREQPARLCDTRTTHTVPAPATAARPSVSDFGHRGTRTTPRDPDYYAEGPGRRRGTRTTPKDPDEAVTHGRRRDLADPARWR